MSSLDDFSENTEVFKPQQNLIDPVAFKALVEEHGVNFAKGYLKAIHEMAEVIGNIIVDPQIHTDSSGEPYRVRESQAMAYGKLWHLHKALYRFIQESGLPVNRIAKPFDHGTKAQNF